MRHLKRFGWGIIGWMMLLVVGYWMWTLGIWVGWVLGITAQYPGTTASILAILIATYCIGCLVQRFDQWLTGKMT